jgi:membrane protein implicated in regulation of membrane protease activity
MEFEIWHLWLMASILFFISEIVIPSFVVFNFGIGSLFGCLAAAVTFSVEWQLLFFSLGTISSFFLIRPILKRWAYKRSHQIETNVNAMIGRTGVVSETIDPIHKTGRVKLDGDYWMAQSANGTIIETNELVRIKAINSIVLEVEKTFN